MRTSKYIGFLAMVLGALIVACAAALPVKADRTTNGVIDLSIRLDGCGPAASALVRDSQPRCQEPAQRRLVFTTTVGAALMIVGLVMFVGGDQRGSRIQVSSGPVTRRSRAGSRGSRRYMPG